MGWQMDLSSDSCLAISTATPRATYWGSRLGSATGLLMDSLMATELYRVTIENDRHVQTETLLSDLARIRDIEVEAGGTLLLLLEHESGGRIVRMSPADADPPL